MKKKTGNRVSVGPLKDSSGRIVTDDKLMAEQLNLFFALFSHRKTVAICMILKIYLMVKKLL